MGLFDNLSKNNLEPITTNIATSSKRTAQNVVETAADITGLSVLGNQIRTNLHQLAYFNVSSIPERIINKLLNELPNGGLDISQIPYPYQDEHAKIKDEYWEPPKESPVTFVEADNVANKIKSLQIDGEGNTKSVNIEMEYIPNKLNVDKAIDDMFSKTGNKENMAEKKHNEIYKEVKNDMPFNGNIISMVQNLSLHDTSRFGVVIKTQEKDDLHKILPEYLKHEPFLTASGDGSWLPVMEVELKWKGITTESIKLGEYSMDVPVMAELPDSVQITLPELYGRPHTKWISDYIDYVTPLNGFALPPQDACYLLDIYVYERYWNKCAVLQVAAYIDSKVNINSDGSSNKMDNNLEFKILGIVDTSSWYESKGVVSTATIQGEEKPLKEYEPDVEPVDLDKLNAQLPKWVLKGIDEVNIGIREELPTKNYPDGNQRAETLQIDALAEMGTFGNPEISKYIDTCWEIKPITISYLKLAAHLTPNIQTLPTEAMQWSGPFVNYCMGGVDKTFKTTKASAWLTATTYDTISKPKLGCVVVFVEETEGLIETIFTYGTGHVGIVLGGNKYGWIVLSGCQNDEVNVTKIIMDGKGEYIAGTKLKLKKFLYPIGAPSLRSELLTEREIKALGLTIEYENYFK